MLLKGSRLDLNTLEVVKKALSSSLVKVLGMSFGLLISVALGNILGSDGLGIINLSVRIVTILLIIIMFGFENVLLKNISIAFHKNDWQVVANNVYTSVIVNLTLAVVVVTVCLLLVPYCANAIFHKPELEVPLAISIIAIIPQTYSRIIAASLNGFRKVWQSNLVNETLSNWFVALLLLVLHLADVEIDVNVVAYSYGLGRVVVLITVFSYWKVLFKYNGARKLQISEMVRVSIPLLIVSATSVISTNVDVIMLGVFQEASDVGLYSVAIRLALLVNFFLMVTNSSVSPKIASLFSQGKLKEMELMLRRVAVGLFVIGTLSLLFFGFFGKYVLVLWGEEFKVAYWPLVVLSLGQFINIVSGCSGGALVMCGYEKLHGVISTLSVLVNITLNYFLINRFGILGAAFATSLTVGAENIVKVYFVKLKLGISMWPNLKLISKE